MNAKHLVWSLLLFFSFQQLATAQFARLNKKFDYSLLESKVLYIPTFQNSEKLLKRMERKGQFEKLDDRQKKIDHYNTIWKEAMEESSYSATEYQIRSFDYREMIKSKNRRALLLYLYFDDYGNVSASMWVAHPKRQEIARVPINGFDLSSKNDIRLMINMLNEQLLSGMELEEEGSKKNSKAVFNKYKEGVVNFFGSIDEKTFLVPEAKHKKPEKAAERTADLKEALKAWTLSEYELTTEEAIEEKRLDRDTSSYYWRDIPYYTNTPITYHINAIISTENDDVLIMFMGKKRLKPATLEQIEKKIVAKAEKYKEQLGK
jgi:hypothetical protein